MTGIRTRIAVSAIFAAALALLFIPNDAAAHYPQISPIGNLVINMNETGPLIRFLVSDRDTPSNDLVLTYRSDNPTLIPEDDDHITLGGTGQDRTITVTPAQDQYGEANVTVIVTDGDGDQNREPFLVVVNRPI